MSTHSLQVVKDGPTDIEFVVVLCISTTDYYFWEQIPRSAISAKALFSNPAILRSLLGESAQLCAPMRLEQSESQTQKQRRCSFVMCKGDVSNSLPNAVPLIPNPFH